MKYVNKDILEICGDDIAIIGSTNCKMVLVFTFDKTQTNGLNIKKVSKKELEELINEVVVDKAPEISSRCVNIGKNVYISAKSFDSVTCVTEVIENNKHEFEITIVKRAIKEIERPIEMLR